MKKFFVLYLSIITLGFLLLPFDSISAAATISCNDCACTYQNGGEPERLVVPYSVQGATQQEVDDACIDVCWRNKPSDKNLYLGVATNCQTLTPPPPAAPSAEEAKTEAGGKEKGLPGGLINPLGGTAAAPKGVTSIPAIIGNIIKAILGIIGSIAFLMFIYGGFLWMTAAGDAKKVEKGRDTLVWATIGLATIFFAYAAVSFVIKSITGGAGGGGTEATTQVVEGFCLCPTAEEPRKFTKSSETTDAGCEEKDCQWVFGACKVGSYYFVESEETCRGSFGIWEGTE